MSWLLFITLLVAVHFGSMPSICATILASIFLLAGYFFTLKSDDSLGILVDG
jgi:hypothetical protein